MKHINKISKLTTLLMLISMISSNGYSQSKYMDQYMMPDPQTWGFIKYGGQTPDLYTGTVRAEIPIFTYNDPDFDIPISLIYASNGYTPNVQANFVGLGWILNAGGCVSRKVQGIADEGTGTPPSGSVGVTFNGYLKYSKIAHSTAPEYERPSTYSGVYCYNEYVGNQWKAYETEQDIFSFNFLGHNGKFVIGDDGNIIVFNSNHPAGEYKIDMDDMTGATFPRDGLSITTGDGYRYDFGQLDGTQLSASKYTKTNAPTRDTYDNLGSTWQLRQITAPNGRTVTFNYCLGSDFDMCNERPFGESSLWHRAEEQHEIVDHMLMHGSTVADNQSFSYILQEWHRVPRLESISIGERCVISFTYSGRTKEKNHNNSSLTTPQRLSGITVTDCMEHRTLEDCTLTHCYSSSLGNPVMMLKSVNILGLGEYVMSYYHEDDIFPKHGCLAIDHWGFFNSNSGTTLDSLLPDVDVDYQTYAETVIGTSRNPDPSKAIYGMLREIVYPTGGKTEYEYEPHTYRKLVTRDLTSENHLPYLKTLETNCVAGGLRIHKITDIAGNEVSASRIYKYEDNGVSSGTMLNFPRYSEYVVLSANDLYQSSHNHSTSLPSCLMDENHIGYSKVVVCYADGSSTSTSFTDYSDYPDIKGDLHMSNSIAILGEGLFSLASIEYPLDTAGLFFQSPQSMNSLRGRPKEKKYYSSNGVLLRRENITYSGSNSDNINVVKDIRLCYGHAYVHNTYVGNSLIDEIQVEEYDNTGPVVRSSSHVSSFGYNNLCQRTSETIVDERGVENIYRWYFPHDLNSRTITENAMIQENIIDSPIYELVLMKPSGGPEDSAHVASARHNSYNTFNSGSHIYRKLYQRQEAVIAPESNFSGNVSTLDYRTILTINSYDTLGRPTSMTDKTGLTTTIQWGYGGLYPTVVDSGGSETTWTYIPFVGVSSRTNPDGRTTYFSYDTYGRLISSTRPDGNMSVKYIYNIGQ